MQKIAYCLCVSLSFAAACNSNGGAPPDASVDSSPDVPVFDAIQDGSRPETSGDSSSDGVGESGSDALVAMDTPVAADVPVMPPMPDVSTDGCGLPDADMTPAVTAVGTLTGSAATAVIGAGGGTIATADGRARLTIPVGALSSDTAVGIAPISDQCPAGIGSAYRLTPDGLSLASPATLTFHLADAELASTSLDVVGIASQHPDDEWYPVEIANTTYDHSARTVSASISQFGDWAPFATVQVNGADIDSPEAVFVDDTKNVGVFSTMSISGPLHGMVPSAGLVVEWSVNGIVGGDSSVGTIEGVNGVSCFGASTIGRYTAPSTVPRVPATITGSFSLPGRGIVAVLSTTLSIFYHHYGISYLYEHRHVCSDGVTPTFIDNNNITHATFALDHAFRISLIQADPVGQATVTNVAACQDVCPAPFVCTLTLDSTASPTTPGAGFTDAAGGFDANPAPAVSLPDSATRNLHVEMTGTFSDFPALVSSFSAPGITPQISHGAALIEPFEPGQSFDLFTYFHGYDGEIFEFNRVGSGPCTGSGECDHYLLTLTRAP